MSLKKVLYEQLAAIGFCSFWGYVAYQIEIVLPPPFNIILIVIGALTSAFYISYTFIIWSAYKEKLDLDKLENRNKFIVADLGGKTTPCKIYEFPSFVEDRFFDILPLYCIPAQSITVGMKPDNHTYTYPLDIKCTWKRENSDVGELYSGKILSISTHLMRFRVTFDTDVHPHMLLHMLNYTKPSNELDEKNIVGKDD